MSRELGWTGRVWFGWAEGCWCYWEQLEIFLNRMTICPDFKCKIFLVASSSILSFSKERQKDV